MKPTTDLEELICHLSGRGDQGIDLSGDQSQLLDAIRARTRVLFEDRDDSDLPTSGRGPNGWGVAGRGAGGTRRSVVDPLRWALASSLLAAILGSGAVGFWWLGERSASSRSREQTRILLQGMRSILAANPPVDPDEIPAEQAAATAHLRQIESELAAIQGKLDALSRLPLLVAAKDPTNLPHSAEEPANTPPAIPGNPPPNPDLVILKADLAAIRRELASGEAATARQIQEMRTVLHEVNTVIRRVLNRPQPAGNSNVTLPLLAVAVQALINNLQHQTAQVRGEAVEQLIRLGPLARSALPALQQMMTREPDPNVRSAVETAVSVISSN